MSSNRQLAAILFTDIAGYTAMMQEDETAALAVVRHYTAVLKEVVPQYQGTIVNDYGDGNLCTFTSATEAVRCAIDLQRKLQTEPRVPLRVGLHIGEIFFEDGKVFGDGVNVASRIQSLGVANSILFSGEIFSKISNQTEFKTVSLGSFHFKNVTVPMEVFALANEGLVVPERSNMEGKMKVNVSPIKKWIAVAAVILVGAVLIFLYKQYSKRSIPGDIEKSIAVLAFEDMSPNKDQGWFSDGISEEIINSLTNLKELKVMARTSSFYFKGKVVTLAEIAERLGVEHIVQGSVKKVDDQLRITVQLINAKDGFQLFSRTYNRPASDLLNVQTEIAEQIAIKLLHELTLTQAPKVNLDKTLSVEAYENYLRGLDARDQYYDEAVGFLLKSISIDPTFGAAYGALADVYDSQGGAKSKDRIRYWRLRDSVSRIGYMINPKSPYVLLARHLTFKKTETPNLDSAFYFLRKAHSIDSSSPYVNRIIGNSYIQIGLYDKGIRFLTKALELDPLNSAIRRSLGLCLMYGGDLDKAKVQFRKAFDFDPLDLNNYSAMAQLYLQFGDLDSALYELKLMLKYKVDAGVTIPYLGESITLAAQCVAKGEREQALKTFSGLEVLSMLNMRREMLAQLDTTSLRTSTTGRIPDLTSPTRNALYSIKGLDNSPIFDFIRSEPEFKRIRERVKKDHDEKLRRYGTLD